MCLFCKIAAKEIPSKVLFEDDDVFAFHDINPVAPTHVLVIPKVHLTSLADAKAEHADLMGKLLLAAVRAAEAAGLKSYRFVANTGADAGQSVFHLHLHVIGGRPLAWPPG